VNRFKEFPPPVKARQDDATTPETDHYDGHISQRYSSLIVFEDAKTKQTTE
jgi:hypothetical protein